MILLYIDVGTILWEEEEKGGGEGEREERGRQKKRSYEGVRQIEAWGDTQSGSESDEDEEDDDKQMSDMELSNDGDTVGQLFIEVGKTCIKHLYHPKVSVLVRPIHIMNILYLEAGKTYTWEQVVHVWRTFGSVILIWWCLVLWKWSSIDDFPQYAMYAFHYISYWDCIKLRE